MGLNTAQLALVVVVTAGLVTAGAATTGVLSDSPAVSIERIDESKPASADSAFEVETTLSNADDEAKTRTATLLLNDDGDGTPSTTVAEQSVTIPAGGSTNLTLTVPAGAVRPGTYEYVLVVGDESATARGNVTLQPTTFVVDNATVSPVVRSERGQLTATVHNRGDFEGMDSVTLRIDRDRDGEFTSEETVDTASPMLSPRNSSPVTLEFPTDELSAGTYDYRLVAGETATEGRLTVKQPATVRIEDVDVPGNITRGAELTVNATLHNEGDVPGTETLALKGPAATSHNRSTTLAAGESTTVTFTIETENLTRGNYTLNLSVADDTATAPLRVRESHFQIVDVDGPETVTIDDELQFTATVHNTGDAPDNQTIEYRIDLNDDDKPESYGLNQTVVLAPGNQTTVQFTVPYGYAEDPIRRADLYGTHIYGVYSEDTNATSVVAVKSYSSDTSDDDTSSTSTTAETVSLSEISQEKYGYDYERLSGETRRQVEELHERQPFAGGRVVTEVMTREEIARQQFGLDVERGDNFEFDALPVETQQEIEAAFDAQFQTETGDRIDSWDELAQQRHGSDYDSLTDSEQQAIRDQYWEQFDG